MKLTSSKISEKYDVEIYKPDGTPATSITVLLPGTMLPLKDYESTYNTLLSSNQVVIAFKFMNPFPVFGRTHKQMAKDVRNVVREFHALDPELAKRKYNIVGHGLGAKVALMVAGKYDTENVGVVVAIDPTDHFPKELSSSKNGVPRTNLSSSKADEIHLFQSDDRQEGWLWIHNKRQTSSGAKESNGDDQTTSTDTSDIPVLSHKSWYSSGKTATGIHEYYKDKITTFTINEGAGPTSYLDTEKDEASKAARRAVNEKIQKHIQ